MTLETITPNLAGKTVTYACPFCGEDEEIEITVELEHVNGETTAHWASIDASYTHTCQPKETR